MLLCCLIVMCLFTFTVTSQCIEGYSFIHNKATLDRDRIPVWSQTKFSTCVNGAKVASLKAKTIHFERSTWAVTINALFNFTYLEEIYMDMCDMRRVPMFYDLPSIKRIYLNQNNIENITRNSFSAVPVQVLALSRNQITTIADGAFGDELNALYLTCNNLIEFSPAWFRNASALITLTIGANKLTSLPENVFEKFVNLRSINLRNNEIVTIGTGAFGTVADYYSINLSYNNISEIPEDAFTTNHVNISVFDMQYNRLSFLSDPLLKKLQVASILTWANPWQCPCETKIERWINNQNGYIHTQIKRDEDPNCVFAQSFSNKCVPYPDDELYNEFLKNFITQPLKICY